MLGLKEQLGLRNTQCSFLPLFFINENILIKRDPFFPRVHPPLLFILYLVSYSSEFWQCNDFHSSPAVEGLSFQIFSKYKKEDEYLNKDFKFTLSSSKYP